MAQAFASATGSACALQHGSGSAVQTPLRSLYRDCTSYSSDDLADATTTSQLDTLIRHGGGLPQQDVATALRELIATMAAMADERSLKLRAFNLMHTRPRKSSSSILAV
ncbi:hypothetical protein SAMN05444000_1662 [Shimia gijangensis]|uniref:Uncharacterized protein n=1 Tax=Shimia gijangensis TaxID=1470563 RepID=A0A1M6UEZ0_9RHOB|nr:hypothetical protein SAMN05444000_1662 [Shimia gijangensis]